MNGRSGTGGKISLFMQMEAGSTENDRTIDFDFDDDSNFQITIPGTPTGSFGKRGWFMREDQGVVDPTASISWTIHVPASPTGYTDLVLTDAAPTDGSWTFSCAGPSATKTTANNNPGDQAVRFKKTCSAGTMTLTVPSVPRNTSIDFYFKSDITPGAEGLFYNDATAQSDERDTVRLPYEERRTIGSGIAGGTFVVSPVPPAGDPATCVDDVNDIWVPAKVTLPVDQEGVTYSMTPNPFPETGGDLVVIATLSPDYVWAAGADSNG